MITVKSTVTLELDRITAAYLMALVGSLKINTGVGDRLSSMYDLLMEQGLECPNVSFRVDPPGDEEFVMFLNEPFGPETEPAWGN